jgi:hypothetical protein
MQSIHSPTFFHIYHQARMHRGQIAWSSRTVASHPVQTAILALPLRKGNFQTSASQELTARS